MKSSFAIAALLAASAQATGAQPDIHFLLHDSHDASTTNSNANTPLQFFQQRSVAANIKTTVFGGELKESHAPASSSKLLLLKPLLEVFPNDEELIVVGDAQHVALNLPEDQDSARVTVDHFVESFHTLTHEKPHSVVFSADDTCCSAAMSHVHPLHLFADDGKRLKRTCTPGNHDCQPLDNDETRLWKDSMEELARDTNSPYMYLNSGVLAGYKNDLLQLLEVLKLDGKEDDQAVLTALMLSKPDVIVLDYQQQMFGNNHNANPDNMMEGCKFEHYDMHGPQLVHIETKATPFVLQTSGKYHAVCMDFMIEQLGGTSQERYLLTSDFFNSVAEFDSSANDREFPLPPQEEEDPENAFFGAGNEGPPTSSGRVETDKGETITDKADGIHDMPVTEDSVDSSGFDFPDFVPNYFYGNYMYGNYGGNKHGGNFWNYGDNDNVSNYGGNTGDHFWNYSGEDNESDNMWNYGMIPPSANDNMNDIMWHRPRTSDELPRAKTPIGQLEHKRTKP